MQYKHYSNRPGKLTSDFVQQEFSKLEARIPNAEASETPEAWLELFADWNALKSYINGEGSRIDYKLAQNMSDPASEEMERYYREEVAPVADNGNSTFVNAVLNSKHKEAIAKRYGNYLIQALETAVEPLAPVNNELRVKVGELATRYNKIVSGGEVTVDGKTITLAVARNMQSNANPAIRKEAFTNYRKWFLDHHDELAKIYDEMVKLRHQMAKNLGHENYIRLGYLSMGRTDYGPEQAAKFRENVRKYAVPLQKILHEQQAEALGETVLRPWDAGYHPKMTLPSGIAPVQQQLDNAQIVFNTLSPDLAKHFLRMRDEGLIDLENRKGKRAGAFCTSFSDEGRVAIFCNSTGDEEDVSTLMHEMGHAFQAWESQVIEAVDLQWPTSDAAEVHSMGMEYLSMPHMTQFFDGTNAEKFRRNRWRDAVELMCYIAIVDEFQHWVYENPNATIAERDQAWNRIWDIYKPGMDFTGIEEYKYARWYAQGHIFQAPFYYIDYAIAETGAMQLALIDSQDHNKAMNTYIKLCRIGGTESVLNIFKMAGLRSPFDDAVMKDLMEHAAKELGVEEYA